MCTGHGGAAVRCGPHCAAWVPCEHLWYGLPEGGWADGVSTQQVWCSLCGAVSTAPTDILVARPQVTPAGYTEEELSRISTRDRANQLADELWAIQHRHDAADRRFRGLEVAAPWTIRHEVAAGLASWLRRLAARLDPCPF